MKDIYIKLDKEWTGTDKSGNPVTLPAGVPIEVSPAFASGFDIIEILENESLTFTFNDFSGAEFRADTEENHLKLINIFDKLLEFNI